MILDMVLSEACQRDVMRLIIVELRGFTNCNALEQSLFWKIVLGIHEVLTVPLPLPPLPSTHALLLWAY